MPIILEPHDKPRNHLVIPDDHAYPEDNFRRFKWLGQYIIEQQPEVIVRLGDSWDMPSLCTYDKGKKSYVFKNVQADIEAGHTAEKLIFDPLIRYNRHQKNIKQKQYKPLIIKILGNHEHRVDRLLSYEPQWEGTIGMNSFHTRLPIKELVVPFMEFILVDGVAYSHYFVSGAMGRPFATARAMLGKRAMSTTMGHTHMFDTHTITRPTGENLRGLIAGSFHDPDHESFAGTQVDQLWWNGLFMKHAVKDGDYDLEEVSINRLRSMYA